MKIKKIHKGINFFNNKFIKKIYHLVKAIFKKFIDELKPFNSGFYITLFIYIILFFLRREILQINFIIYLENKHPFFFYLFIFILLLVFILIRKRLSIFFNSIVNYLFNIPPSYILLESTQLESGLYSYAKLSSSNKKKLLNKHTDIIDCLIELDKLLNEYNNLKTNKDKFIGKLPYKIYILNDYILFMIKNL